ncbi:hypothetical protein [Herbiconiux sp.]|uniref:hypothetical protein n=1 Tax=Herbiconiux sp. TaxID=1871186 RepID=UPI0025B9D96E|nr:hypothetical protein [Herbiconiux sp.]
MRRIGRLSVIALVLGLAGCAGADDSDDRARYDAMLEIEKVPGVLVAPYERYVQIDPAAPEDEIVTTALAVREILDGLGSDRPNELDLIAVYPGDAYVTTEFTTRSYEDADRFERDVRIWAGLLDEGFTEVRYNVFDEAGDGVLNVHSGEPGEPGPTVNQAFDAMVAALGDDLMSFPGLQTEALVGDVLVTNRSGHPALPAGWDTALEEVTNLEYIPKANAQFESDTTALRLTGATGLTAEQTAEILGILGGAGVLQPSVSVSYAIRGDDDSLTTLFGAAP